jgi:hypothetical protein
MMSPGLEANVVQAEARYDALIAALNAIIMSYIYSPMGITAQTMQIARDEIMKLADAVLVTELNHAESSIQEMIDNVALTLGLPVPEHMMVYDLTLRYLEAQIVSQMMRDIAVADQAIGQARLTGQNLKGGYKSPAFMFYDRLGRQTPSARFVRGLWRMTLISAHNETVLEHIIAAGQSRAAVLHDVKATEIITIYDDPVLRSYVDVREELFHPNSNAYLWSTDNVST